MKGLVFTGGGNMEIREFPVPAPGANQAVIKVKAASVCGSDMHFYKIPLELYKKLTERTVGGAPGIVPGTISGHEASGVVERTGPGVTNVKAGDRVVVYHHIGCGHCEQCVGGNMMSCPSRKGMGMNYNGSNAEYVLIDARNCEPLPDELSYIDGAFMGCIAATAFSALTKLKVSGRELVAVYGLGPVGLTAAYMAKAMGATVVGLERHPYRINLAKECGIDYVIDTLSEDPLIRLMELSRGTGIPKALEATGSAAMRKLSAAASAVRGMIAFVGVDENIMDADVDLPLPVDARFVIRKELRIQGSYVMPQYLFHPLARFLIDKKVDLNRLVTHHFRLDQAREAYDLFESGNSGKIIFDFD